jgi:hypothetical protein
VAVYPPKAAGPKHVSFHVTGVKPASVRAASLRIAGRPRPLSLRHVRRGIRRGRVVLRLPRQMSHRPRSGRRLRLALRLADARRTARPPGSTGKPDTKKPIPPGPGDPSRPAPPAPSDPPPPTNPPAPSDPPADDSPPPTNPPAPPDPPADDPPAPSDPPPPDPPAGDPSPPLPPPDDCSPVAGSWPAACWRPFAQSSPFNRPIPAGAPVVANSEAIVQRMVSLYRGPSKMTAGDADTASDYSHPLYYPSADDPVFTLHCYEASWGTCPIEGHRIRIPDAARPAAGGDGHLGVIDEASGWEYDLYKVRSKPAGGGTLEFRWGGRTRLDGDGLGSNATAAHFGLSAGIIRAQEMAAERIDHALFMVVKCTSGKVYPALGGGSQCADGANAPAGGMRFQLAYSEAEIEALRVPRWKKTILHALRTYGAYIGDTGGAGFNFQFESGSSYTSFGRRDRLVEWAATEPGVIAYKGKYVFDVAPGVDWSRMRVVDPCVSRGNC